MRSSSLTLSDLGIQVFSGGDWPHGVTIQAMKALTCAVLLLAACGNELPGIDLAGVDLAGVQDMTGTDGPGANDGSPPNPDMTSTPTDSGGMCTTNGKDCSSAAQCCNGKCEVIGGSPMRCCAAVGQSCGTAATGNCCTGTSCVNDVRFTNGVQCCTLSYVACPTDASKKQATADCGNGFVAQYGPCYL